MTHRTPPCSAIQDWLLSGVLFSVALLSFLQAAASRGALSAPPDNGGDADSYERLGYNLAAGLGFGYCPDDDSILKGDSDPAKVERCVAGCSESEFEPTAYRPPGFPFLIAAVYLIRPLDYAAIRVMNAVFAALAVVIVSRYALRQFSFSVALIGGLLCSLDPRFRLFAGSFLTENPATLMFCLFVLQLTGFLNQRTCVKAFTAGLSLSALVFVRSFFVTWYPVLWGIISVLLMLDTRRSGLRLRSAAATFAVFAFASLLLTGPWWIRNCLVLQAVMPAGTQGGIGIADGFSDSAYAGFGSWSSATAGQIAEQIRADPATKHLKGIEFEKEHSRRGSAHAREWIRRNPEKLLQLSWWKLSRLWESESRAHWILFAVMFIGLASRWRNPLARVLALMLLLNSLTVVATYHTYERFLTPFRPLIHCFAACGLESCLRFATSCFQRGFTRE